MKVAVYPVYQNETHEITYIGFDYKLNKWGLKKLDRWLKKFRKKFINIVSDIESERVDIFQESYSFNADNATYHRNNKVLIYYVPINNLKNVVKFVRKKNKTIIVRYKVEYKMVGQTYSLIIELKLGNHIMKEEPEYDITIMTSLSDVSVIQSCENCKKLKLLK